MGKVRAQFLYAKMSDSHRKPVRYANTGFSRTAQAVMFFFNLVHAGIFRKNVKKYSPKFSSSLPNLSIPVLVFLESAFQKCIFWTGLHKDLSLNSLAWTCLPSLALPDGAHHHDKDSSVFLLPSKESNQCLFAVSCYRQIETKKLKVKDEEVTRDTVQKYVFFRKFFYENALYDF